MKAQHALAPDLGMNLAPVVRNRRRAVIIRRVSANEFFEIATSAIWNDMARVADGLRADPNRR